MDLKESYIGMKKSLECILNFNFISVILLSLFYTISSLNDILWMTNLLDVLKVILLLGLTLFLLHYLIQLTKLNVQGLEVLIFLLLFIVLLLPKLHSNFYSFFDKNIKLTHLTTILICTALFLAYQVIFKPDKRFSQVKNYLTMLMLIFILIEISIVPGIMNEKANLRKSISNFKSKNNLGKIPFNKSPNIYHIIFDAYTGFDALKKHWNYSDITFLKNLNTRNVEIAFGAHTCKDNTLESINALYNLSPFNHNIKFRTLATKSNLFRQLINNSVVPNNIASNGYEVHNLSIFDINDEKRYWNFPWLDPNINFTEFCFNQSLIGSLYKNIQSKKQSSVNLEIIEALKNVIKSDKHSPLFTYAHLIMPHPPQNFDKNGNYVGSITNSREAYLDELQYCNKIMVELIDLVRKHDPTAILILQSDHGSGMLPEVYEDEVSNILCILVAPEEYKIEWPNNMINHNTYKYIFNALSESSSIQTTQCQD